MCMCKYIGMCKYVYIMCISAHINIYIHIPLELSEKEMTCDGVNSNIF